MINFVSLGTLCTDLLYLARGSKVVSSETITFKQLEHWIHGTRALLLKQSLDKGNYPDESYIQEIKPLELEPVDIAGTETTIKTGKYVYRTKLSIPNVISLSYEDAILFIGTLTGEEIQFVPESRVNYQQYNKYSDTQPLAYIKANKIYVVTSSPIKYISLRGIFEVPTEVLALVNPNATYEGYEYDMKYPLPYHLVSTLKEMILKKELGIMLNAPSDNTNDSQNKVESNIEK